MPIISHHQDVTDDGNDQVLLDTADSVMDTKRKIEFGVQQIIFKVTELVELSGGQIDDNLANKFESITRTILSNQTEALANLTRKIEKEIGQVSLLAETVVSITKQNF